MQSHIISVYKNQIDKYSTLLTDQKSKYQLWSFIRFFSFLLFVALIILAFNVHSLIGIAAIYFCAFIFIKTMRQHDKISDAKDKSEAIIKINTAEIKYLEDHLPFRNNGDKYEDLQHPYSSDLDLFGENSLFHHIERSCTRYGRNKIAARLSKAISKSAILQNQEAITELEAKLDWRQGFMAYSLDNKDEELDESALQKWKEASYILKDNKTVGILRFILPVVALGLFVLLCFYVPWYLALLVFLPSVLLQRKYASEIDQLHTLSEHSLKYISNYRRLIEEIENESFTSTKLKELQAVFLDNQKTSKKLKKLDFYLSQIDIKNNDFGFVFNIITLYDVHFTILLEKWKEENQGQIDLWTDALAEFEFLQTLANLANNNPSWTFPMIQGDHIDCKEIGHPLIQEETRINNTISLPASKHIKLVTGSNMAGKSTFQRTIGMNMLLAYCGSKVCAKEMALPILQILSSMRTQDDLSKSASGFYAELLRLKVVLDEVQNHNNNYFFIDEILKGTNTQDRHKGSKALIKQLLKSNGAGLISTHDLELAKLEESLNGHLENICFEVDVLDDKLIFDYKLRKGVSKSFNASRLMENIGIDIDEG